MYVFPIGAIWSVLLFSLAQSISNITFYSDSDCANYLAVASGPDDGTCTQFPSGSFGSFRVTSLDSTCAGPQTLNHILWAVC